MKFDKTDKIILISIICGSVCLFIIYLSVFTINKSSNDTKDSIVKEEKTQTKNELNFDSLDYNTLLNTYKMEYLLENYGKALDIANYMLRNSVELSLSEKDLYRTQFYIYDCELRLFFEKRKENNMYIPMIQNNYLKIDLILLEIIKYTNDMHSLKIITNDPYMNKIFNIGLKYSKNIN